MTTIVFAYPWALWWTIGATVCVALYVFLIKKKVRYRYALAGTLKQLGASVTVPARQVLFLLRFLTLLGLALLVARPQYVDSRRDVHIKGIDIVLALDVSGSMEHFDDLKDRTPRIEAARKEALHFVAKRTNDPIGIVLFARQALSKMPLTLDKTLLANTLKDLEVGEIDANDTLLFTGLATAINRLRTSTAKSKIIVLLTDGIPSLNDPVDADTVINLAKEFGIKIYTMGVGRSDTAYAYDAFGRVTPVRSEVAVDLLERIAKETAGAFYRVHTPAELRKAYADIDALERVDIKTSLFQNYIEAFSWFIWFVLLFFSFELILRMGIWRGLV